MGLEHLVVAVRAIVERDGEDLATLQILQQRGAARAAQVQVAEWPGQAPQRARVDEECPQFLGQLVENVAGQVFAYKPGASAERLEQTRSLHGRLVTGGQVEELEPRGPSFRASGQPPQLVAAEHLPVVLAKKPLHLPRPEPQVVARDLEQVARESQAGEVERGQTAGSDDNADARAGQVDEPSKGGLGF